MFSQCSDGRSVAKQQNRVSPLSRVVNLVTKALSTEHQSFDPSHLRSSVDLNETTAPLGSLHITIAKPLGGKPELNSSCPTNQDVFIKTEKKSDEN